jgi:hypothetical protein
VAHTLMYAAFLEDPLAWTLLGAGLGLLAVPATPAAVRSPGASASGRTRTGSRTQ